MPRVTKAELIQQLKDQRELCHEKYKKLDDKLKSAESQLRAEKREHQETESRREHSQTKCDDVYKMVIFRLKTEYGVGEWKEADVFAHGRQIPEPHSDNPEVRMLRHLCEILRS